MPSREQNYGLIVLNKEGDAVFSAGLGNSAEVVEKFARK